jgi:hypothetical protein
MRARAQSEQHGVARGNGSVLPAEARRKRPVSGAQGGALAMPGPLYDTLAIIRGLEEQWMRAYVIMPHLARSESGFNNEDFTSDPSGTATPVRARW